MWYLWLIPAFPLGGFLFLALFGRFSPKPLTAAVGAGTVGISMIFSIAAASGAVFAMPPQNVERQLLWRWMQSGPFSAAAGLYLDSLSVVMILVVTVVGFLIHLYSVRFMDREDTGYARFFAYMNLFIASMLVLVLSSNLLLLFLGWEGVGLCSYLLIGFWYKDPANNAAAIKAFIVTRTGDAAFLVGLLLLFTNLGTLDIQDMMSEATRLWAPNSGVAVAAALLLLGGALGKSAQLPLQVWLPDAMAGPSPVSALIHAATMVTAGVYLIARTHVIFNLAPGVRFAVAIIGGVTLLIAGFSAITQHDIKRVLAYSTISQIGYMFLALGVGAWPAAVFHLVAHAAFKSLLFLGAGVVIRAMGEEHDIEKMGGLWNRLPFTFWTFLIGCLSMAAIPPLTAGFYSKDWILYWVWTSDRAGTVLWAVGLGGVLLTSTYTFRMLFLTFLGPLRKMPVWKPSALVWIPLVLLAVPAALIGYLETPRTFGDLRLFSHFIHGSLPAQITEKASLTTETVLQIVSEAASALGILVAYYFFVRHRKGEPAWRTKPGFSLLYRFLYSGWGFDRLYGTLFVRPYRRLAAFNRSDFIDSFYGWIAALNRLLNRLLSASQTGRLRLYSFVLAAGAAAILLLVVVL